MHNFIQQVKNDIRIWSVKQHSKDGFICKDYEGTVVSMALYGRKEKVNSDHSQASQLIY